MQKYTMKWTCVDYVSESSPEILILSNDENGTCEIRQWTYFQNTKIDKLAIGRLIQTHKLLSSRSKGRIRSRNRRGRKSAVFRYRVTPSRK